MRLLRLHLAKFPLDSQIVTAYSKRFLSSDVAWMAGGFWNDGKHDTSADTFHNVHLATRAGTKDNKERKSVRKILLETVLDVVSCSYNCFA